MCFLATQSINKVCLWTSAPVLSSVVFWHSTADIRLLSKIPIAKRQGKKQISEEYFQETGSSCLLNIKSGLEWVSSILLNEKKKKEREGRQLE